MKKLISFLLLVSVCLSMFALIPTATEGGNSSEAPVYYGVQRQTTGENKQNLRFISLVNSLEGSSVGYEITVKYGENTSVYTYEETATNVVYSSIIANNKTVSASSLGAKAALMTVVIRGVPTNIGVIDFTVTPCVEHEGEIIRGETRDVRFNGAEVEGNTDRYEDIDISVMSFNVLNVWTGTDTVENLSAEDRTRATLKMACDAELDFVCFQEFDINYRHYIDGEKTIQSGNWWNPTYTYTPYAEYYGEIGDFKAKYAELSLTGKTSDRDGVKTIEKQSSIWNPIYYDQTKYIVVDRGVYDFVEWGLESYESINYVHDDADGNTSDSRSLVWGVFEHIDTGERVIVTNTHFSPTVDSNPATLSEWAEVRRTEGEFVADKVDALYAEYQCPVVMCGDYNSTTEGRGCKTLLDEGYKDTWQMAGSKVDSSGYHENCVNRTNYSESSDAPDANSTYKKNAIDHILSKTELNVKRYDIIIDRTFEGYSYVEKVLDLSDHCPVVMTFAISVEIEGGYLDMVVGDAQDVTAEWVEE